MTMGKSPFMMEHCGDRKSWTVMVEDHLRWIWKRWLIASWRQDGAWGCTNICWTFLGEAEADAVLEWAAHDQVGG